VTTLEFIKDKFERGVRAMEKSDRMGRGTAVTKATIVDGLRCEVRDGEWTLAADMPDKAGGGNAAPNPGVYGRTALATCVAIGYSMWAARRGVALTRLEVEVQADYDARGEYGVTDDPAGYLELRYVVTAESEAPEEDVRRVLDEADAHSAYVNVFREPQDVRRLLTLNGKEV
jgi:uncharacterized OsmC-like protein